MQAFYIPAFIGGLVLTAISLWLLVRLAPWAGLVDHPKGRKQHERPTPVVAGLAILLGCAAGAAATSVMGEAGRAVAEVLRSHIGFLLGGAILAGVGAWDDRTPLPARYKLFAQLLACVLAVFIDNATVGETAIMTNSFVLTPGPLTAPFTVIVMLTVTNSINMIDGVDGLAGGMIFVALAILAKATTAGGYSSAILILALLGGLSAFLAVNFPLFKNQPAKVFLGDCGTLVMGFTIAYIAIELSSLPNRLFKPSTALWLFFIPVIDTMWLYLRRTWFGRAPFAPGRDHIHHLLMARFTPRMVTWILVGASALMAGGAYFADRMRLGSIWLIVAFLLGFLLYGAVTHKAWKAAWLKSRAEAAECEERPH